jgi:hypothetical protein
MPRGCHKLEFGLCAPVAAILLTDWGLYSPVAARTHSGLFLKPATQHSSRRLIEKRRS